MKSKKLTELARNLRGRATPAEKELWKVLRNRGVGDYKFVRQFPIPPFIVDFCCRERKVVVELDGGGYLDKEHSDREREKFLESLGYHVIRFINNQVLNDTNQVYESILSDLKDERSDKPLT
jgi:very-short-patch-repair endonuclease